MRVCFITIYTLNALYYVMHIAFLTTQVTPLPGVPAKKWDILKSIVYGGLLESIASLTVVTSAAGADATACKFLCISHTISKTPYN